MIDQSDFNNILTLLNTKRTDVEKSTISHSFSGIIKQSDIDVLRNGTVEILEDYGFTGLGDALSYAGYDYSSWKTWEENYIAARSLYEITNILNLMFCDSFSYSNLFPYNAYTVRKAWGGGLSDYYDSVWGSAYGLQCGEFLPYDHLASRAMGYFPTEAVMGVGSAKVRVYISRPANYPLHLTSSMAVCQATYSEISSVAWEAVGTVIGTVLPPTADFYDDPNIRDIEIDTSVINIGNRTDMAFRLINDTTETVFKSNVLKKAYLIICGHF